MRLFLILGMTILTSCSVNRSFVATPQKRENLSEFKLVGKADVSLGKIKMSHEALLQKSKGQISIKLYDAGVFSLTPSPTMAIESKDSFSLFMKNKKTGNLQENIHELGGEKLFYILANMDTTPLYLKQERAEKTKIYLDRYQRIKKVKSGGSTARFKYQGEGAIYPKELKLTFKKFFKIAEIKLTQLRQK